VGTEEDIAAVQLPDMECVRSFVVVAEEGQFQLAASRLGISQQAVSKRIAALEADLATTLFKRTPAGAVLTKDGQAFLPHANAILAAVRAAVGSVRPQTRPLRVDVLARNTGAFDLLRGFRDANPRLPVEMVTGGGGAATIRSMLAGEIDAGYAYLRDACGELSPLLSFCYAFLEPVQVIVGARHPLALAGRARAADLAGYPAWVPGIVAGSEWETFYQDFAGAFGLGIDATGYTAGTESVFDDIAASRSLMTFVGERSRVALPSAPALARLAVVDPVPLYPWSLIWRSQTRHPGTRRLIAHVKRSFKPPGSAAVWLPRQARDDLAGNISFSGRLAPGGDLSHLGQGLLDDLSQGLLAGPVGPATEGDLEDGDAGLGGQARPRVGDAAPSEGFGERFGERRELDQLALPQLRVRGDDGLALSREVADLLKRARGALESRADRVDRRQCGRRVVDPLDEPVLEHARAVEQHLALVGEVPEEGPLGEARAPGDLRDRRLVVPALAVELKGGQLQAAVRVGLPPGHKDNSTVMTATDMTVLCW
jgi:DNA-binding transcriptional LysR family regulator